MHATITRPRLLSGLSIVAVAVALIAGITATAGAEPDPAPFPPQPGEGGAENCSDWTSFADVRSGDVAHLSGGQYRHCTGRGSYPGNAIYRSVDVKGTVHDDHCHDERAGRATVILLRREPGSDYTADVTDPITAGGCRMSRSFEERLGPRLGVLDADTDESNSGTDQFRMAVDYRLVLCVSAANKGGESDRRCSLAPAKPEVPAKPALAERPPHTPDTSNGCGSWTHRRLYQNHAPDRHVNTDFRWLATEEHGAVARAELWLSRDCDDARLHVVGTVTDLKGKHAGIGLKLKRGWMQSNAPKFSWGKETAKAKGGRNTSKEFHFDFPSGGDLQVDINDVQHSGEFCSGTCPLRW